MFQCNECYWSRRVSATSEEQVCCNENSEHYNEVFPKEESMERGCEEGETRKAIDYRNMTAWQFASKYYM